METTQVPDTKTVGEIQALLARRGATSVMVEYEGGNVVGVAFRLNVKGQDVGFRLPCRWAAVETQLRRSGRRPKKDGYQAWARRVAWRQILRWVEAQLALVETGMVQAHEVFLPYAIVRGQNGSPDQSVFGMMEQHFLALPAPKKEEANA